MTTARRRNDLGNAFTFGGRVPRGLGVLLAAILTSSVVAWVTGTTGAAQLVPVDIVRGQVWRLVSWAFVQGDALTLIFGGLVLFSIGGQLAFVWSERRLIGTYLALAVLPSAVTVFLAYLGVRGANQPHIGMWPVVNGLILMWAMLYPDRQVSIWGVLPVTGRTVALLIVFGTLLYGLSSGGLAGIGVFTVHFAALALAFALSRGAVLPTRRWTLAAREWWQERQFKRRSRHLKVVKKNGSSEPPRWMN